MRNFSITIAAALQITTTSLPNGSPSVFYSATLAATGGIPPYSWTIAQGSLPSGITLNATSGMISGTPTATGTSSFTVQASDSETPAATATTSLSIVITPPPPRNAALYISQSEGNPATDRAGLQIQSNGSLTPLPSSPESAVNGSFFGPSPTLPLLFLLSNGNPHLESLLINPDYSLTSYSSAPLAGSLSQYARPVVDPTGSNLYLPGPIDSSGTPGVTIFPGNGSLQPLSTIPIPNVTGVSGLAFTPDGTLAFIPTCSPSNQGSILSYSRSSDGTLTSVATYALPNSCAGGLTVSADGKYLATEEVQIYKIASDGTLTPVLPQPFTVTFAGGPIQIFDLAWDPSGSYLLVATGAPLFEGGLGVLSFSGSTLTETVQPTGGPVGRIQQTGSFVYGLAVCINLCEGGPYGVLGFNFQNGQLTPIPGSPYPYGNGGDMVIY